MLLLGVQAGEVCVSRSTRDLGVSTSRDNVAEEPRWNGWRSETLDDYHYEPAIFGRRGARYRGGQVDGKVVLGINEDMFVVEGGEKEKRRRCKSRKWER